MHTTLHTASDACMHNIRLALITIMVIIEMMHSYLTACFLHARLMTFQGECVAHLWEAVHGGIRSYLGEEQQQGDWHCCTTQSPVTCSIKALESQECSIGL